MANPTVYNTGDKTSQFENTLIYGLAGAGKTPISATLPDCLIVSSEPGLKSLQNYRIPFVQARNFAEAMEVLRWITTGTECRKYQNIFFDSISMLSEYILIEEQKKSKDARQWSPATSRNTMDVVLGFLQSIQNKNVWMTSKAAEVYTTVGVGLNASQVKTVEPFTVLPKLGPALPYHFNNVLYMSRHRDSNNNEYAMLTCRFTDMTPQTRNRSGMLATWEPPDLSLILKKTNGVI